MCGYCGVWKLQILQNCAVYACIKDVGSLLQCVQTLKILKFLMYGSRLCTVEHRIFELSQSSLVYGCMSYVVVRKDFENFKAHQRASLCCVGV